MLKSQNLIAFQVRFAVEPVASVQRVFAPDAASAAAEFVARRDAQTALAKGQQTTLVVVAAEHEAYIEGYYRVACTMAPRYAASLATPGAGG